MQFILYSPLGSLEAQKFLESGEICLTVAQSDGRSNRQVVPSATCCDTEKNRVIG